MKNEDSMKKFGKLYETYDRDFSAYDNIYDTFFVF
jgi:hypothetical protein